MSVYWEIPPGYWSPIDLQGKGAGRDEHVRIAHHRTWVALSPGHTRLEAGVTVLSTQSTIFFVTAENNNLDGTSRSGGEGDNHPHFVEQQSRNFHFDSVIQTTILNCQDENRCSEQISGLRCLMFDKTCKDTYGQKFRQPHLQHFVRLKAKNIRIIQNENAHDKTNDFSSSQQMNS